jgi:hypothetical protein
LRWVLIAVKQDALPWQLHKVADWLALTRDQMIERARSLPPMPRRRVDGQNRWKVMLSTKRSSAKENGRGFSISVDDVPFRSHCPMLGCEFLLMGSEGSRALNGSVGRHRWNSASLDQIVAGAGYPPGNVVLVSDLANCIMADCTSPDRVRRVALWFDAELAAAPHLAAMIQDNMRAQWAAAAE